MTTAAIREKLHDYINIADDKKIEAIYTMVEDEITAYADIWEDEEFLAAIVRRLKAHEAEKVKCLTWDEVQQNALGMEICS